MIVLPPLPENEQGSGYSAEMDDGQTVTPLYPQAAAITKTPNALAGYDVAREKQNALATIESLAEQVRKADSTSLCLWETLAKLRSIADAIRNIDEMAPDIALIGSLCVQLQKIMLIFQLEMLADRLATLPKISLDR